MAHAGIRAVARARGRRARAGGAPCGAGPRGARGRGGARRRAICCHPGLQTGLPAPVPGHARERPPCSTCLKRHMLSTCQPRLLRRRRARTPRWSARAWLRRAATCTLWARRSARLPLLRPPTLSSARTWLRCARCAGRRYHFLSFPLPALTTLKSSTWLCRHATHRIALAGVAGPAGRCARRAHCRIRRRMPWRCYASTAPLHMGLEACWPTTLEARVQVLYFACAVLTT